MGKIVTLTRVDKDRKTYLNSFGLIDQMVFVSVSDALYHIFITNPLDSTISIHRTSDDFAWITVVYSNEENRYYELRVVKPLSFCKNE